MHTLEYKVFSRRKHHISSRVSEVNRGPNIRRFVFSQGVQVGRGWGAALRVKPPSFRHESHPQFRSGSLFKKVHSHESQEWGETEKKLPGPTFRDVKERNTQRTHVPYAVIMETHTKQPPPSQPSLPPARKIFEILP